MVPSRIAAGVASVVTAGVAEAVATAGVAAVAVWYKGGLGGVTFQSQLLGTLLGIGIAVAGGLIVYGALKLMFGIRLP